MINDREKIVGLRFKGKENMDWWMDMVGKEGRKRVGMEGKVEKEIVKKIGIEMRGKEESIGEKMWWEIEDEGKVFGEGRVNEEKRIGEKEEIIGEEEGKNVKEKFKCNLGRCEIKRKERIGKEWEINV